MENTIKRKVNRVGLVGQIVTIILIVLMSVACLACLSGGITLAALPKDAAMIGVKGEMDIHVGKSLIGKWINKIPDDPTELNAKLGVNGTEYNDITVEKTESGLTLYASSERFEFRLTRLATAAFSGFVYCAALLVVFVFLKRLCDAFRSCETPFADDVIRRMTVFAWVLMGCAVLSSIAEAVGNAMIRRSIDLSFSLNPANMNTGLEVSFSFAPILIALLVLFLTVIFRYGAQLQKESDEIL